jgi:hypothetical protein
MEQPKIELPAWLPWATTACLAALTACLGELWMIEKARTHFLREQGQLSQAALRATQNELDAERILEKRAVESLRAGGASPGAQVLLLAPPGGPGAGRPAAGAVVVDPSDGSGLVALSGAPAQPEGRDYQLWLEGPAPGLGAPCGVFHGAAGDGQPPARISARLPLQPGWRLLLIEGTKGGERTLEEAKARGSIVLATSPFTRRIPGQ